jgi:hypothetical protein
MATKRILLGFEIDTAKPVNLPLHHVVAVGMTQLSGKTTTLEALIHRSGLKALAFKTKRGERGFEGARLHSPYFHERADWQYVQGLLEATLRERMRFERSWIIRACKGTRNLREVLHNVEHELEKARGLSESVYTNLKAYLEIVLPEIEKQYFTSELHLTEGVNVMDLTGLRDEVQGLIIASTIDAIYENDKDVIVVIPEAWKFVPEGRSSPVKHSAERMIRQGAAIGDYLYFDSQDISGVDKALLKQVDNWILGRQREINEVEHTLAQLPIPKKQRPRPEEIMQLQVGQFFACFGDQVRKVYVQPIWLSEDNAKAIALGERSVSEFSKPLAVREDDSMLQEDLKEAMATIAKMQADMKKKDQQIKELADSIVVEQHALRQKSFDAQVIEERAAKIERMKAAKPSIPSPKADIAEAIRTNVDIEAVVERVLQRLKSEPVTMNLTKDVSDLNVTVKRPTVQADDEGFRGRIALLITDGFFDQPKLAKEVALEAGARGWGKWTSGGSNVSMYRELNWFTQHAFLRSLIDQKKWIVLEGVRKRIKETEQ